MKTSLNVRSEWIFGFEAMLFVLAYFYEFNIFLNQFMRCLISLFPLLQDEIISFTGYVNTENTYRNEFKHKHELFSFKKWKLGGFSDTMKGSRS